MVKGFHSSSTWGFPKGKIAKGETPEECAVREVQEEIGFDIGPNLSPEDYIQIDVGPHAIRLYIIPGVSESETKFYTKTRKEIGAIQWFATSELSSSTTAKFYNVSTFIGYELLDWHDKRFNCCLM